LTLVEIHILKIDDFANYNFFNESVSRDQCSC